MSTNVVTDMVMSKSFLEGMGSIQCTFSANAHRILARSDAPVSNGNLQTSLHDPTGGTQKPSIVEFNLSNFYGISNQIDVEQ